MYITATVCQSVEWRENYWQTFLHFCKTTDKRFSFLYVLYFSRHKNHLIRVKWNIMAWLIVAVLVAMIIDGDGPTFFDK